MKKRIALVSGKVFPGKGEEYEAILVSGDQILGLGSSAKIMALAGPDAQIVDLGGRRVIPGLVDSHNHVLSGATLLSGVNCFGLSSIDELKQAVAKKAAEVGPGEWVLGAGWIESQFKENRMPNRKDLDEAAPHNPVLLVRLFAVTAANSLALQKAGIGKGFAPSTGRVDLDDSGEPTGILREGAAGLVRRASQEGRMGARTPEALESMVKLALNEYLRYGMTSVLDPGVSPDLMLAYTSLHARGELPLRVTAMPVWHGLSFGAVDQGMPLVVEAGLQPGMGDKHFRFGNLKMAIDGGLGSKTALMHEPFRDFTRATVPLRLDTNKLGQYVRDAHAKGWGVGIHCCGDLAQDMAVSHMVDALTAKKPLPHQRHHIVHGYYPTEYSLRAMAAHDIAISVQPGFIYVEGDIYPTVIQESRLAGFKPLRTYLNRGIRVAINTDVSSAPYDPFVALYGAVGRKTVKGLDFGQAEALTAREAVSCFCEGGAYLAYRDAECGTLEPGKLADLAVLDTDILEGPAESLLNCKVDGTMVGGKFVYLREGSGFRPAGV